MTSQDAVADPQQIITDLERKLAESVAQQAVIALDNARLLTEQREALEQQAATAEILKVINSSPNDLTPVFDIILEKAHSLCDITTGSLELYEGDIARSVAARGMNTRWEQYLRQGYKITKTLRPAYMAAGHSHVIDMKKSIGRFPDEPIFRDFVEIGGLRTFLGLTLAKDGKGFGRIVAARDEVRPFTDRQIALLQSFADQAVIAIENARLLTEQREALERQTATADILKVISSSVADTMPVFEQILDSCERLAAFNRMAIFLLGEDGQVHVGAYRGAGGDALKATFPQPLANTPMSLAFESQQALFFGDVLNNADAPESLRVAASKMGSFSVLVAPLLWEGRGIGAFHVARDADATFSDREVALLKTFADQAAIAIQNARLFNETREALEQQKASADILAVISSSVANAQPVFDKILASCKHLFGGDELDVLLVDEQGQLNIAAYLGDSHDVVAATFPAPVERTPAGRAIGERRVMHWPDLVDGEDVPGVLRKMAKLIGYRSMVFAPMLWEGRGIGAIGVARSTGAFKPKELAMIQTFADQAVIAIQNARLFNETREALERQTATSDVLQVISSSVSDAAPVFEKILDSCQRLIPCTDLAVLTIESDNLVHLGSTRGPYGLQVAKNYRPTPIDRTIIARAVTELRTIHVPDGLHGEDVPLVLRRMTEKVGHNLSCLIAPMKWQSGVVGALFVTRVYGAPFSNNEISLFETFADQAVIAIQNARLFNETREALERQTATADILKVIASSPDDVQPVFQAIAERSNRLVNGLSTSVFTLMGDMVHLVAFTATHPDADAALQALFPAPLSSFSWNTVILRGETYSLPDTDEVEQVRDVARLRGFRSMLMVPLLRDGEPIGVISQTRREPGPFSDNHVQLLQTFADQAVIAISNVRLFQEVQERTRDLSASLDHLRTAQDRLVQTEKLASLGQLTAGIAHEIKNPLNFVNNFSSLSTELIDELNETLAPLTFDQKTRDELGELTQMLKSNLEKVVQHGKRADSIVKNMLLHSREGSGDHRSADINALVEESLNLAYHGARAEKPGFNIMLTRDLDPDAGEVELYPQEITRALLNLISNGFYATVQRKSVEGETFEPVLTAVTKNLGKTVEIRIRDNGTGIPSDVREKMFNPFFTTKPAGEGTGLGLSMSHDIIVKQHGGTIDVETDPGLFTEFKIVLPRTSQR